MSVTFDPACFDPAEPVQPAWEDLDDLGDATGHFDGGWEAEPRFRVETETPAVALDDGSPSVASVSVDQRAAYVGADTSEWLSHEMAAPGAVGDDDLRARTAWTKPSGR